MNFKRDQFFELKLKFKMNKLNNIKTFRNYLVNNKKNFFIFYSINYPL